MRKLLYIVIFFSSSSNAQNLIQNGGFEEYDYCPVNLGEIPIKYWYSPTLNTPDYFHSCVSNNDNDVPNNNFGWQFAQQGEGYVGEMTTYPWDNQFTNRDYLTNRLSGILKEDSTYCLTFISIHQRMIHRAVSIVTSGFIFQMTLYGLTFTIPFHLSLN
ncbi:MAG: hypothetical protein M0D57_02910 [Sphingobacteriales bacterium JAD_PAG50586_3]|nr:MAG: hypothetical protein M0D57_02910 [Sphingobacteriales bacterium JAD_PAG50586_3]